MPNWVKTQVRVNVHSKEEFNEIINDMITRLNKRGVEIDNKNFVNDYNAYGDSQKLRFSDYIEIPTSISRYDTTNIRVDDCNEWAIARANYACDEEFFKFTDEQREKVEANHQPILTASQITTFKKKWKKIEEQQEHDYGVVGWYDWNYANFGCKWDCKFYSLTGSMDECFLILELDTPWTPAEPIFRKLVATYPNASFEIFVRDEGDAFMGIYTNDEDGALFYEEVEYGVNTNEEFFETYNNEMDEDYI